MVNSAGSLVARGKHSDNRRDQNVMGRASQAPMRPGMLPPHLQFGQSGLPVQVAQMQQALGQQALGQQPADDALLGRSPPRGRGSGPGSLDQNEILHAVESLYEDMLKPYGRILRKRLAERAASAGKGVVDVDIRRLRSACEACPWLQCQVEDGGDWSALHRNLRPNFVDVYSPLDIYPQVLWSQAHMYFESLADSDMVLPGGRYSCAQALMARNLPFLSQCSLGQVCHIVQLAISQKKLLGYLNGAVVPYSRSQSMVKERCAESQRPCANAARGTTALANWDAARTGLREILASGPGSIPLSNVKRLFRSRYHLELSETALGHAKLSELLQDPQLQDICAVRLHGHGYVVMAVMPQPTQKQHNKISLADNLPSRHSRSSRHSSFVTDTDVIDSHLLANTAAQYQAGVTSQAFGGAIMAPPPGTFTTPDHWQGSRTDAQEQEGSGVGCAIQNTFLHVKGELHSPLPGKKPRAHSLPRNIGSDKSVWEAHCAALSYTSPSKENDDNDDDESSHTYASNHQGFLLDPAFQPRYDEQDMSPHESEEQGFSLAPKVPGQASSLAQRRAFDPSRISVSEALMAKETQRDFATETPGPFSNIVVNYDRRDSFLRRDSHSQVHDVFEEDTPAEIRNTWVELSVPMTPTTPYSPQRRPMRLREEPRSESPERVQGDDLYNLGFHRPQVSTALSSSTAPMAAEQHPSAQSNRSRGERRGREEELSRRSRSGSEEDPHHLASTPSPCRSPVRQRPGTQAGLPPGYQLQMQAQLNVQLQAQLQAQQGQQGQQAQEQPQRVVRLADLI